MATEHDKAVTAAALPTILHTHGESVMLRADGKVPVEITAMVIRPSLQEGSQIGPGRREAKGIILDRSDHPTLTLNADKVDVLKRPDDSCMTTMTITRLIEQTDAYWHLGLT